jgi:hypothetical protein
VPTPVYLIRRMRQSLCQPYWSRPWLWLTGAFTFVVAFWCLVFELWLVYAMLWAVVEGAWWLVAVAQAGPVGAVRSRQDDRLHKARLSGGEDW